MSDIFIFHDDVQFSSKSYTKRSLFRKEFHNQETQWLGVSVQSNKDEKISEIKIDHESVKIKKHLQKMEYLYHNTPYFDYYFPTISKILLRVNEFEKLADFNINTIKELSNLLELNSEFYRSSSSPLAEKGNEYNLALVKMYEGNIYYSGTGAKDYQDEASYSKENISLIYLDTKEYLSKHPYPQHQGDFLSGLSVIDTILNIGAVGVREIFYSMRKQFNPDQIV